MSGTTATVATSPKSEESKPAKRKKASSFDTNPAKAGWATKLVLVLICLLWLIPTIGSLVTSFRPLKDSDNTGWWTFLGGLGNLTFDNYTTAITQSKFGDALINSFAITLPAVFIPILIAAFAAYAFTFMEFWGRDVLFLSIVAMLVVPNYVAFVPILKIYGALGLNGSFPAAWLAHIGFGMSLAIYILRNYMATLPKTVIESAKIDGASHFQTFYKLVLPMSVPALASFAIFQFLWVWNDLLVALVFVGPGENQPTTIALAQLRGQVGRAGTSPRPVGS
jgi:alpha-glucoside transport system permease protein